MGLFAALPTYWPTLLYHDVRLKSTLSLELGNFLWKQQRFFSYKSYVAFHMVIYKHLYESWTKVSWLVANQMQIRLTA